MLEATCSARRFARRRSIRPEEEGVEVERRLSGSQATVPLATAAAGSSEGGGLLDAGVVARA
jgi:hypothetical protein